VSESVHEPLLDPQTDRQKDDYQRNIENFIGTAKLPVGIAGPLRINGLFAHHSTKNGGLLAHVSHRWCTQ